MTELQKVRVLDVAVPQVGYAEDAWIQTITAPSAKAHLLRATLADMKYRGEIKTAFNWTEEKGTITVYVERLREPRSPVPWYVAGVTAGFGVLVGLGTMLYQTRYVWLTMLAGAVLVWLVCKTMAGHAAACPGLHCSGCQS
jgi:hypothetical protein